MRPERVPPGPLLVGTDVVSLLALEEERADEFAALVQSHELFVCFVTVAEIENFFALAGQVATVDTGRVTGPASHPQTRPARRSGRADRRSFATPVCPK